VLDDRALRALRAADRLGDLVAEANPPWGFALPEPPAGEWRGAHGSLREMSVPLLLAGAGVRPGLRLRRPRLVDVAPTVAALLGTRPPAHAQGRDLTGSSELT
jgi:arylsulfatase A-like enzyme